jgi:hypothetical protein
MMNKKLSLQTRKIKFATFVIYAFAERYRITSGAAFNMLNKYGVIEHVLECYDTLHTQGLDYIVGELECMMEHQGFKAKQ